MSEGPGRLRAEGVFAMLDTIFLILSVLGVILLILLGILLTLLLLVLFFPVTYRITGMKNPSNTWLRVRVSWLFGIFRLRYQMPKPGNVTAKLLWFTVFDSDSKTRSSGGKSSGTSAPNADSAKAAGKKRAKDHGTGRIPDKAETKETETQKGTEPQPPENQKEQTIEDQSAFQQPKVQSGPEQTREESPQKETDAQGIFDRIWKKIQKIKYTICNIYDKIKQIRENISYYIQLLQEESSKELFVYGKQRLGRILKSLRPRRIRADVLFGTGAPDTTGYVMGIYGILSPQLGRRVYVTPDFTQAVLQGSVDMAGHTAVFTLLWNGARLFLDRRLQELIKKWKAGGKENGR